MFAEIQQTQAVLFDNPAPGAQKCLIAKVTGSIGERSDREFPRSSREPSRVLAASNNTDFRRNESLVGLPECPREGGRPGTYRRSKVVNSCEFMSYGGIARGNGIDF